MAEYKLTTKAVEDLDEIWEYTVDRWSENQAEIYYSMLIDSCTEIAKKPSIGKPYLGIIYQLLGFKTGKHIIFYRTVNENYVEIIRILHEQMDLKNRIHYDK